MTFAEPNARMQAVLDEFADILRPLDVLRQVYSYLPENLGSLPVATVLPFTGTWLLNTSEDTVGLHDVVIETHFSAKNTRTSFNQSMPLAVLVPYTIYGGIKNGTYTQIDTIGNIIYEYGRLGFEDASNATFGWRFTLTGVKTRVTL